MSTDSPILVVTKNFFAFTEWREKKPEHERNKYIYVEHLGILNHFPDADGLLVDDWANRPDAGIIYQWIQDRKKNREQNQHHQKIFTQMMLGLAPDMTRDNMYAGNQYTVTHYGTHVIKFLNGAIYETLQFNTPNKIITTNTIFTDKPNGLSTQTNS